MTKAAFHSQNHHFLLKTNLTPQQEFRGDPGQTINLKFACLQASFLSSLPFFHALCPATFTPQHTTHTKSLPPNSSPEFSCWGCALSWLTPTVMSTGVSGRHLMNIWMDSEHSGILRHDFLVVESLTVRLLAEITCHPLPWQGAPAFTPCLCSLQTFLSHCVHPLAPSHPQMSLSLGREFRKVIGHLPWMCR